MTDSYIAGNEPTKKLQTYENTVGGQSVHSEAVTPTGSDGVPFDALVQTYNTGILTGAGSVTIAGKGKHIRVFANAVDSSFTFNGGPTITIRSGTGHDEDLDGHVVNPTVAWVSGAIDVYLSVLN